MTIISRLSQGRSQRLPQLLLRVQCFDKPEELNHPLLMTWQHIQTVHQTLTLAVREESKLVDVVLEALLRQLIGVLL